MKKSFFPLIIVAISFFLITSCSYAQYSGYFLKGFAEGLQKSLDLRLKKQELQLQKEQLEFLKEIEYLQNESNKINFLLNIRHRKKGSDFTISQKEKIMSLL